MQSRVAAVLVACLVTAACGDNRSNRDDPVYFYEGCESESAVCPGLNTFLCAVEKLDQQHGKCTRQADCLVASGPEAEECVSLCSRGLVTAAEHDAYVQSLKVEIHRYCLTARCHAYLHCPRPPNAIPDCVDGQCVWVEGVLQIDGGT